MLVVKLQKVASQEKLSGIERKRADPLLVVTHCSRGFGRE